MHSIHCLHSTRFTKYIFCTIHSAYCRHFTLQTNNIPHYSFCTPCRLDILCAHYTKCCCTFIHRLLHFVQIIHCTGPANCTSLTKCRYCTVFSASPHCMHSRVWELHTASMYTMFTANMVILHILHSLHSRHYTNFTLCKSYTCCTHRTEFTNYSTHTAKAFMHTVLTV